MVTFSGFVSEEAVLDANANPCLFSKLTCSSWSIFVLAEVAEGNDYFDGIFSYYIHIVVLYV